MRRNIVWLLFLAVIVSGWSAAEVWADSSDLSADVKAIVGGINHFTFDLYAQVASTKGNIFCSPLSVHTALMMTSVGARGLTASEISQTLRVPSDLSVQAAQNADASLLDSLQSSDQSEFQLHVANGLWGQKDYAWLADFRDVLVNKYHSDTYSVDFADPASATKQINDWVSQHTAGKITDLFPPDSIPRDTKLVLGNAVYFKGDWVDPFEAGDTSDRAFHTSAQADPIKTPMMRQDGFVRAMENDQFQALELPYKGKSISMLILLPKTVDGLAALESSLSDKMLDDVISKLEQKAVEIWIPKFKTTARLPLKDDLESLGMHRAFSPRDADFSGIDGRADLFIGAVQHQGWVSVDEKGTEAAAATGVAFRPTMVFQPAMRFTADHPFFFVIRDNRSGAILFVGRLMDPRQNK